MSVPIPTSAVPGLTHPPASGAEGATRRAIYIRQAQTWATEQERYRHMQALYHIGEWVYLVLMWHELDFEAGLVGRCTRCFAGSAGAKSLRIANVYDQPIQNECPVCFGTTFEGGYRARIVRPAIVGDVDETERQGAKGVLHPASVTFETAYDFRCRQGDYVFRADGSRWRIQSADRLQVRVGFAHAGQQAESVAYRLPAALEDRTSVAYKIPPLNPLDIRATLTIPMHYPGDFSAVEVANGPLIPPSIMD